MCNLNDSVLRWWAYGKTIKLFRWIPRQSRYGLSLWSEKCSKRGQLQWALPRWSWFVNGLTPRSRQQRPRYVHPVWRKWSKRRRTIRMQLGIKSVWQDDQYKIAYKKSTWDGNSSAICCSLQHDSPTVIAQSRTFINAQLLEFKYDGCRRGKCRGNAPIRHQHCLAG